jgi:hypothetical protein
VLPSASFGRGLPYRVKIPSLLRSIKWRFFVGYATHLSVVATLRTRTATEISIATTHHLARVVFDSESATRLIVDAAATSTVPVSGCTSSASIDPREGPY